ncbi:MAG: hypothetical protein ABI678_07570 [Kofleriaceae bacterium]
MIDLRYPVDSRATNDGLDRAIHHAMSNFIALDSIDLAHVTGGAGIDDPVSPSLSDLRSSNIGFGTTSSSTTQSAPAPRQIGAPLGLPGGGTATFGR